MKLRVLYAPMETPHDHPELTFRLQQYYKDGEMTWMNTRSHMNCWWDRKLFPTRELAIEAIRHLMCYPDGQVIYEEESD